MEQKKRLCNIGRTPGSLFCGTHRPLDESEYALDAPTILIAAIFQLYCDNLLRQFIATIYSDNFFYFNKKMHSCIKEASKTDVRLILISSFYDYFISAF